MTLRIAAFVPEDMQPSLAESLQQRVCAVSFLDTADSLKSITREMSSFSGVLIDCGSIGADQWSQIEPVVGHLPIAVIGLDQYQLGPDQLPDHANITSDYALSEWLLRLASSPPSHAARRGRGRLVVVAGAEGAPGRTVTSREIARASIKAGHPTLIVDADTSEPGLSFGFGLAGEESGLKAALRSCRVEGVALNTLVAHAASCQIDGHSVLVLTGYVCQASPEHADSAAYRKLLDTFRDAGYVVVVDTAGISRAADSCETNLDLWSRQELTPPLISYADHVVVVAGATELAISRFVRVWHQALSKLADTMVSVFVSAPCLPQALQEELLHTIWQFTATHNSYFAVPAQIGPASFAAGFRLPSQLSERLWTVPIAQTDKERKPRRREFLNRRKIAVTRLRAKRLP